MLKRDFRLCCKIEISNQSSQPTEIFPQYHGNVKE